MGNNMFIQEGILSDFPYLCSPHQDDRPDEKDISLLVVHNISLPPGEFCQQAETSYISDLFLGRLDASAHAFFAEIAHLRVSAHCLICRNGELIQYVPFHKRAWHAGVSVYQGRQACNDYAIGIELEGTDDLPYTDMQYQRLAEMSKQLMRHYPGINLSRIVGHNDIAPGRKTDPGVAFDWARFRRDLIDCQL